MQNQDQLNGQSPKAEERPASAPAVNSSASSEVKEAEQKIVEKIFNYIKEHPNELAEHYLSVKTSDGKNRKQTEMYQCEQIGSDAYLAKLLSVSVVILTANYFESEILNRNISNKFNCPVLKLSGGLQLLHDRKITHAYIFELADYTILHLHAPDTGSNTPCGSADLVRYVNGCEYLNPSCIISFGICFGTSFEDNLKLGDTIIAEKIYPWSVGVKISLDKQGNTTWKIKDDSYTINLREYAQALFDKIEEVCNTTDHLCLGQQVKLGNMITSEAVVSNELVKRSAEAAAHGWEIIGGEMEGYGLAKEALYYGPYEEGRPRIACVILKAICDWGAVKNIDDYINKTELSSILKIQTSYKDQIQAYAAYCAYQILEELLENHVFDSINIVESFIDALSNKFNQDLTFSESEYTEYLVNWLKHPDPDVIQLEETKKIQALVCKYNILSSDKQEAYQRILSKVAVFDNPKLFSYDPASKRIAFML